MPYYLYFLFPKNRLRESSSNGVFKVVKTTDESRKVAAVVSWTAMSSGRKNLTPPNLSEAQLCLQMAVDYFPIAC